MACVEECSTAAGCTSSPPSLERLDEREMEPWRKREISKYQYRQTMYSIPFVTCLSGCPNSFRLSDEFPISPPAAAAVVAAAEADFSSRYGPSSWCRSKFTGKVNRV